MSLSDQTQSREPAMSNGDRVVLVAEKITKRFPGTVALDQVDFTVYAGSVNVLIGENGAGSERPPDACCSTDLQWNSNQLEKLPKPESVSFFKSSISILI